jgi:asparagine N-glycosylation enzyme membrane subunit Stt3
MRKFETTTAASLKERSNRPSGDGTGWLKNNKRSILVLCAIVLFALLLRVFYAYGISAGSDYALSGGSSAAYHLHVIETLITKGQFIVLDPSVNYPFDGLNTTPPMLDLIVAFFAWIAASTGVSAATASSGALAWFGPIVGSVTCVFVYFLGKEVFSKKAGILAALLYALFPITIISTVFSNGTEAALYGFLFVLMSYFLVRAVKSLDSADLKGFRSVLDNRVTLVYVLASGITFGLLALSWNGFYAVVLVLVALMASQAVLDRFRSKDFSTVTVMYSMVLMIGVLIAACYYIPAGLWDAVFSGPFLVSVLSAALCMAYAALSDRPWTLTLPALALAVIAFFAVMFFAAPDLFGAMVSGNDFYENPIFSSMVASSAGNTLSELAIFFGWAVFWFPMVMFLYMAYRYPRNMDSRAYTFILFWTLSLVILTWASRSVAFLAAPMYAVGGAALIVWILDKSDTRGYFASFKGADIRSVWKRILKPAPLITVLVAVFLVAMPAAIYAVDASISSNEKANYGSNIFGASGYYVDTDASNNINNLWEAYSSETKAGALVTWIDYSYDAVNKGGFLSVTDSNGGGASAASNILLAEGSAGATAAMAVRLMMSEDIYTFQSILQEFGLDVDAVAGFFNDPASTKSLVLGSPDVYGKVSQNLTDENATYLATVEYLTSSLSETDVNKFYDKVCSSVGKQINYVAVDGSMMPLYYGDGSYFMTLAYLNDYAVTYTTLSSGASLGSPGEFYSYSSYSPYYCSYTDPMYESMYWRALIGMSPSDAGVSSGISYLSSLALSDGTYKAVPGYGLSNYAVVYWHVMYNEDGDATLSSDGWVDMDAYEAMSLQESQGGLINYIAGTVMLEYKSSNQMNSLTGKISYNNGTSTVPAEGIQVAVHEAIDYNGDGIVDSYVQRCTAYTDSQGRYEVSISNTGVSYKLVYSIGTSSTTGGREIKTLDEPTSSTPGLTFTIGSIGMSGSVTLNDSAYATGSEPLTVKIEGSVTGYTATTTTTEGYFAFSGVMPDQYTITVAKSDGIILASSTYRTFEGANAGIEVPVSTGKITVTVTDGMGQSVTSGTVIATNTSNGAQYEAQIGSDGKAVIQVVPGTFTLSTGDGIVSVYSTSVTVASGGSKTASLTVYGPNTVTVNTPMSNMTVVVSAPGITVSANTGSAKSVTLTLPVSVGAGQGNGYTYTVYATDGSDSGSSKVYWTTFQYSGASSTVSLSSGSVLYDVSGVLKNRSGNPTDGSVYFTSSDGKTIFAESDGGDFATMLPSGTYTMYAYDGSYSAILKTITVGTTDLDLGDVEMSESRTITTILSYKTYMSSGTTKGLAYLQVDIDAIVVGTETFSLSWITDSSGKAVVYIPSGSSCTINVAAMDSSYLTMEAKSKEISAGSSSSSNTFSATAKEVTVKSPGPYEVTLEPYSSVLEEVTVTSAGVKVAPGQYTAVVKASSGYYYEGTVYIYPGKDITLSIDTIGMSKVTLSGASSSDEVEVTSEGKYIQDKDDGNIWYLQDGYDYVFAVTDGSDNIAYASLKSASGDQTLTVGTKYAPITVTGFVGVTSTGTLSVTYGSTTVVFDVADGVFNAKLPSLASSAEMTFTASVSQTVDGKVYHYIRTSTVQSSGLSDGSVLNLSSVGSGISASATVTSANTSSRTVSFTVNVSNTSGKAVTLVPEAGSAWESITFSAASVTVPARGSGTITVSNAVYTEGTAAGSSNLSVTLNDATGVAVQTVEVDVAKMYDAYATNTGSAVFQGGSASFSFTVTNNLAKAQTVVLVGGSAWLDIDFYLSGSEVKTVTIPASGSVTVNAVAAYDPSKTAQGSDSLSVSISNVNGTTIQTLTADSSGMVSSGATSTGVDSSLGQDASSDSINGFEYMYALTVTNSDNYTKYFTVSILNGSQLAGWYFVLMDGDGKTIVEADSGHRFPVAGYSEATVYIKLMSKTGESHEVPSVQASVSVYDGSDRPLGVVTSSSNVSISGNIATANLTASATEMNVGDPSVSGENVHLDPGSIPAVFWAILAIAVILLMMVVWLGMRRGVFTRRK